jgi:putative membrane protein
MRHLKSTLARLTTAAAVLGAAACSSNPTPAASSPSSAKPASTYSKYGPAMGEGSDYTPGPSTEATPGEVGLMPPPMPSPVEMGPASPALQDPAAAMGSTRGAPMAPVAPVAPVTWGGGGGSESNQVGVTNPMASSVDLSTLNDSQFAAIVQAINEGEIEEAQLALGKATSQDVKRFARDMTAAHRDMQNKMTALLVRLEITPSDNAVSNQLKSDTQSELAALKTMRGKDFDRDYIDAQVRNHNEALELLDRITPTVKSSELKAALASVRPKVEAHLREAERVELTLQKGTANPQPGSSATPENTR